MWKTNVNHLQTLHMFLEMSQADFQAEVFLFISNLLEVSFQMNAKTAQCSECCWTFFQLKQGNVWLYAGSMQQSDSNERVELQMKRFEKDGTMNYTTQF